MLSEFEATLYTQRLTTLERLEQPWGFTRAEGDVRCIAHIINLAVQAALTHLKAEPSNQSEVYRLEDQHTRAGHNQIAIVSALSKLQSYIYLLESSWLD